MSKLGDPTHAFFTPVLRAYFSTLDVSATFWWRAENPALWYPIHASERSTDGLWFERHFAREGWRSAHNDRSARRAARTMRPILAEHLGFADLWVPIRGSSGPLAFLAVGPFLLAPPTAKSIERRFARLASQPAMKHDPIFSRYVDTLLETTIVSGDLKQDLLRFGAGYAKLVEARGDARKTFRELWKLQERAERANRNALMWRMARGLTDPLQNPSLRSFHGGTWFRVLGISRVGSDVVAAIAFDDDGDDGPLQARLRAHRFQHECSDLAQNLDNTLIGGLGSDGVFAVVHAKGGRAARRTELRSLVDRFRGVARRYGFELCAGVSSRGTSPADLPERHREALMALEWSMHAREPLSFFEDRPKAAQTGESLHTLAGDLREELARGDAKALALAVRRFIDEVLRRTLGNIEAARGYFETAVAYLVSDLERRSAVDVRTVAAIAEGFEAQARASRHGHELSRAFERTATQLSATTASPRSADRDERLERARALIDRGFREPITLESVSRQVGFSPAHFSRMFHRHTGVGFARYVTDRRLAHATKLLASSELPIGDVAEQSGFRSYVHFARALHRSTGLTARKVRKAGRAWPREA